MQLSLQTRVNGDLHSIIKQAVGLRLYLMSLIRSYVVDYIKLDSLILLHVLNPKVKPLSMPLCVDIILHEKVVLIFLGL